MISLRTKIIVLATLTTLTCILFFYAWKLRQSHKYNPTAITRGDDEPEVTISDIRILRQNGEYHITSPAYTACLGADGNLHSLAVSSSELLDDTVHISRGVFYTTDDRLVEMPNMTRKSTIIGASNGMFFISYEFRSQEIKIRLNQISDKPALFTFVGNRQITAIQNLRKKNENAPAPITNDWSDVRLTTSSGAWIELTGGTRLRGDWGGKNQAWELELPPSTETLAAFRFGTQ